MMNDGLGSLILSNKPNDKVVLLLLDFIENGKNRLFSNIFFFFGNYYVIDLNLGN